MGNSGLFLGSVYATMELDFSRLSSQARSAQGVITGLNSHVDGIRTASTRAQTGVTGLSSAAGTATGGLTGLSQGAARSASSLSGVGDSASRAEGQVGRFSGGLSGVAKGAFLGTVAATGFTAGIAAIAGAARESLGALMNLQNARASFEALTGSAANASMVMKDLATYASSTPFEFGTIAQAGKTLLGFGTSVGDVGKQMRMLGDIAGATGGDLSGIARVFGQVQAAGKVTAEDFNQLIDNGVALGDVMAKEMGIPVSKLKEQMEKGNVTFDVFNKAVATATSQGGKFFGGADKLSQTLSGRISTLKDNFTGLVGAFVGVDFSTGVVKAGGAFDLLSNAILMTNTWISANQKLITGFADLVGGTVIGAVTNLFNAAKVLFTGDMDGRIFGLDEDSPILGVLFDINDLFRILFSTIATGTPSTYRIGEGFDGFSASMSTLSGAVRQILPPFISLIKDGLQVAIPLVGIALVGALQGAIAVIKVVAGVMAGWVDQFQKGNPLVQGLTVFIAGLAVGFAAYNAVMSIAAAVTTGWAVVTTAATAVGTAFATVIAFITSPVFLVIAAIAALVAIGFVLYKNWDTITAGAKTLWGGLGDFFGGLWSSISSTFMGAWGGIKAFFAGIPAFFMGVMNTMIAGVTWAVTTYINFWLTLPENIARVLGYIVGRFIRFVATDVPNFVNGIISWVSSLPGTISTFFTTLWANVSTATSNGMTAVLGWFQALPGRIAGALATLWSTVVGWWNSYGTWQRNTTANIINGTVGYFQALPGRASNAVSGMVGAISGWFHRTGDSMRNGASSGIDTVVGFFRSLPSRIMDVLGNLGGMLQSKFRSVASAAWDGFKNGLGIHSPSYIEEAFMAIERQGADTTGAMRQDMSKLNSLANSARRITTGARPNASAFNLDGGAEGNGGVTNFHGPVSIEKTADANEVISILSRRANVSQKGIVPA